MVVYSLATLLLVLAVMGFLTRRQQSLSEMSSQRHPMVGVETTRALENPGEAKTLAPSVNTGDTSAFGNMDVNNHYRIPDNVAGETKSKQSPVTRDVVSTSDPRVVSMIESHRRRVSEDQNRLTGRLNNATQTTPIAADRPADVRDRELPSVSAVAPSPPKPQPVSRVATERSGPAPVTTQLISPSKSSPPKGREIQWP